MTKEELEKVIAERAAPLCVPYGCTLDLQSFTDGEIKLKLACPPLDIFKVQGKIVRMEDEIKKKIADHLASAVKDVKVTFA